MQLTRVFRLFNDLTDKVRRVRRVAIIVVTLALIAGLNACDKGNKNNAETNNAGNARAGSMQASNANQQPGGTATKSTPASSPTATEKAPGKSGAASSETNPTEAEANVAGRWSSEWGPTTFTQNGSAVSGTVSYTKGGTCQVNGTLDGHTLTFRFRNSFGEHGTGTLTLSNNGRVLNGSWHEQRDNKNGQWRLTR